MTLVDQAARDRIASDHTTTLFVEAGAGSGKTSSLVSRFVSLVSSGVDVTSIAAITFTEAAASELRTRVRQALERLERGEAVGGVPSGPEARDRATAALDNLDRATISTLHAFAQRILLSAPVEAEVPPALDVHDDISSALRFEERWQRFERRLLDDDDLEVVMRAAFALGIGGRDLQSISHTLTQNWDLVEEMVNTGATETLRQVNIGPDSVPVDDLIEAWSQVCNLAGGCTDPSDSLLEWICTFADPMRDSLQTNRDDLYSLIEILTAEIPGMGNKGRKANWPEGAKDEIIECARAAIGAGIEARETVTDAVLTRLGAEIALYTIDDADARRREGRLEFHDLLVLARRLLRRSEVVRRRLNDQYRHLLIDEFQDTDPIQVELAVRIAADPAHDTALPWNEVDVEEGRLFFVGDPKQSIYRFRRADIDLFTRTADRHPSGYTSLSVNFRTVAPILAFCNAIFERLIQREETAVNGAAHTAQPSYVPLDVARPALDADPGPPVLLLGDGTPHDRAEPARAAEAVDVAAALARARREGWLVEDRTGAAPRPCRWSDMAVLIPSRTTLAHLRSTLDDAGIPYRLETGTLIFGTTEIIDLMAILRALDDPGDSVAIVGALRSPAYGCGDDELQAWTRSTGHAITYLGADVRTDDDLARSSEPVSRVEWALADLRRRHRNAPFRTVPEIIDAVIRERQLMELSLAGGRHRDAWRLYRIVLEEARRFADTEAGSLREFVHWADLQRDDKIQASSPTLPEADVDAVRVLTIHASKGLEFAVTAVSGLSAQDPTSLRGAAVLLGSGDGFEVKMRSGMETTRFQSARTLEETMDAHERIRLLYVALTRARDHLIVSTHHTERAVTRSHGGRLVTTIGAVEEETGTPLAPRWSATAETGDVPYSHWTEGPASIQVPEPEPTRRQAWLMAQRDWTGRRDATISRSRTNVVTATQLAALANADEFVEKEEHIPDREPWRRGRAGTSIGSAVHAVLQHADLTDPAGTDLAGLAQWQAMAEGVPDATTEIERKARAALASPLVRRAVASGRWLREVHVGVTIPTICAGAGGGLFEGFVDLMFDDGDGLVVVDYKTDGVGSEAQVADALARYRPQGAAYAVALEAATGRAVHEVHFLFLRGDESEDSVAVDAPIADLEGAMAEVRKTLETQG